MRAVVVCRRRQWRTGPLAEELTREPDTSATDSAGWSPDGKLAILNCGWNSPENASWEEEHKTFRFTADGCLPDTILLDLPAARRPT